MEDPAPPLAHPGLCDCLVEGSEQRLELAASLEFLGAQYIPPDEGLSDKWLPRLKSLDHCRDGSRKLQYTHVQHHAGHDHETTLYHSLWTAGYHIGLFARNWCCSDRRVHGCMRQWARHIDQIRSTVVETSPAGHTQRIERPDMARAVGAARLPDTAVGPSPAELASLTQRLEWGRVSPPPIACILLLGVADVVALNAHAYPHDGRAALPHSAACDVLPPPYVYHGTRDDCCAVENSEEALAYTNEGLAG